MGDLIEESLLKKNFLNIRKGHNKLLERIHEGNRIHSKPKISLVQHEVKINPNSSYDSSMENNF